MKLRDLSLRAKLLVLAGATSTAALLLSSLVLLGSSYVAQRDNVLREIEAQAAIVADDTTAALRFADADSAGETLRALRNLPSVDVACVFDAHAMLLASFQSVANRAVCPATPPPDQADADWAGIVVVRPIVFKDARIGTVYLRGTLQEVWVRLRRESLAILLAFAVGAVGALLLATRLRQGIARPVLALSSTAAMISEQGDYSLRALKEGDDEIGLLADRFNEMVHQVERHTEDLRAANQLKDDFLATLSHELRTPLNAILGWTQVLRAMPNDAGTTERAIESIGRNAQSQARLIADLLDISSITSGKLRLTFEPVDLAEIAHAATEVVRATAEAKHVAITGPAAGPPALVSGDSGRLEQVIWNLLANAVKFTPAGGSVRVSIAMEGDEYVVAVSDTGQGITPEFRPHVFDRFRQADSSMARRHGGLGLGLAIARELVERHGGRIIAESPGRDQGSTFSFFLRKARAGSVAATPPVAQAAGRRPDLGGLRVLIIDDEADARQVAQRALASAGAHVSSAPDSQTALAILAVRTFDVIVCDIGMPDMNGYEMLRIIRAQEGGDTRVPAIAATAYTDDESRLRAEQAGFEGFVAKPFSLEALAAAVEAVARHPAGQGSSTLPTVAG